MRVLVIGSGAREHALCARLASEVNQLICVPGNPGIARIARTVRAEITDTRAHVELAAREQIDLTVVGPELPLSVGIADRFAEAGRLLFGPSAAAARLESSKAFAKTFMLRHDVPTARFRTAATEEEAIRIVRSGEFDWPIVVKADGLAAGKGVVIADDRHGAEHAIAAAMRERRFGDAGDRLVIEECLTGPEVSFFVMSDGNGAVSIGAAHDHKRIFDDDRGPNTGGMGAFAPSPLVDEALHARIMREIVQPVIDGMAEEGNPFRGFLYCGLMLTSLGPRVIEFNVRLGDPEAQVILPRIDEPLAPMLMAAASGRLRQSTCRISSDRHVGVVIASDGYPETSGSGQSISGLDEAERLPGVTIYHAGTAIRDGTIVTSGGRVLTVVGRGNDFAEAITRAYAGVLPIHFDGMQYRRDIGKKALEIDDLRFEDRQSIDRRSPYRRS